MKKEYRKSLPLTLKDIYEEDMIYNARPSYEDNPWLKAEEAQSNFLTARELIISDMPMIVHEACITKNAKDLLSLVALEIPNNIHTFYDQSSYEALIKQLCHQNKKIFFQYIHGDHLCETESYAVNKSTFIDLNNKTKIEQWTGGKYLPQREIVNVEDFENRVKQWTLPIVIKPGDELPTAGGYGVMICYNEEDLNQAIKRINAATETKNIIIEQFIEEIQNYCVQYSYSKEQGIQYLGAVQQLTDKYGFYNGNVNLNEVPESVIEAGYEIMKNGVEHGYTGVSGFDLLIDKNEDVYAIDLNFRQNGSTSLLLLQERLQEGYHKFLSYHSKGNNAHFLETIKKYIREGYLYPLSYYDGDWFKDEQVKSRFAGIWHAENESIALEKEQAFIKEISEK
ncbi:L-aspartate--L-methionine ligase LdmS [Mammaliicoccus sp. Dog046]|uniref:L-aspartate--L-methionine ligase LdmS n=1 Tax=Mammaliicoccus sp. Dog046 TaxID=3034233 RepID=UPI002B25B53F|nr:ATP-grasp domain-containing protein [Mammaliicoccus sp. Dog046]WQK86071.1 ATP-grasp domain-containing protein [Mammaliicoccus sp. Dog046]